MKNLNKIFALLVICSICALLSFAPNNKKHIVIDAGHGGKDYVAVEGNHYEKEIVRKIAQQIAMANTDLDITISIIGEEDVFVDLEERVKAINSLNPDMLISLHLGWSKDVNKRGANAYVSSKNIDFANSKIIAEKLLRNLKSEAQIIEQDLFVLKNVKCPAATLEVGYLSNVSDQKLLLNEEGQQQLGLEIFSGLSGL